ncbi:flavin reductase family protein [Paraburkholderia xenovorans]|uniref:flavin reductase family protein n=1 Tax=Paraburkholderia xenovorans TaxID=36873 RepID=UPI0038BBE0D2
MLQGIASVPVASSFRNAMSRVGASVHIVTSAGPAGRVGFTASAVSSVTDSPPILLVCVNRLASSHEPILSNGVLCVNTLAEEQEPLSRRFSEKIPFEQRFDGADWGTLRTGSPVLQHALASMDCRILDALEYGTHSVIMAQVIDMKYRQDRARGLIYFDRCYHAVGSA